MNTFKQQNFRVVDKVRMGMLPIEANKILSCSEIDKHLCNPVMAKELGDLQAQYQAIDDYLHPIEDCLKSNQAEIFQVLKGLENKIDSLYDYVMKTDTNLQQVSIKLGTKGLCYQTATPPKMKTQYYLKILLSNASEQPLYLKSMVFDIEKPQDPKSLYGIYLRFINLTEDHENLLHRHILSLEQNNSQILMNQN